MSETLVKSLLMIPKSKTMTRCMWLAWPRREFMHPGGVFGCSGTTQILQHLRTGISRGPIHPGAYDHIHAGRDLSPRIQFGS